MKRGNGAALMKNLGESIRAFLDNNGAGSGKGGGACIPPPEEVPAALARETGLRHRRPNTFSFLTHPALGGSA